MLRSNAPKGGGDLRMGCCSTWSRHVVLQQIDKKVEIHCGMAAISACADLRFMSLVTDYSDICFVSSSSFEMENVT